MLGWVNPVDRLVRRRTSLVRPFCSMLCRKAEEDLDHLFWECQFARVVWSSFLQEFNVRFAGRVPSPSALQRQRVFYGLSGCVLLFGIFGAREMIRFFGIGRGGIVRFGLWLDFTCLFGL